MIVKEDLPHEEIEEGGPTFRVVVKMPRLDEILHCDRSSETYASFMYEFGIQTVGREQWNKSMEKGERYSEFVSRADEAFLLLGVMNIWNKVIDASPLSQEQKKEYFDDSTMAQLNNKFVGRYTGNISQADRIAKDGSNGKPGGKAWSLEGLNKFAELMDLVRESRAADNNINGEGVISPFDLMIKNKHKDVMNAKREAERERKGKRKRKEACEEARKLALVCEDDMAMFLAGSQVEL